MAGSGWPSLGDALEAGYAAARQSVRASNGIRVFLMLLQSRQHLAPASADRVRALACSALLGLARDGSIRHILTKLQVCGSSRSSSSSKNNNHSSTSGWRILLQRCLLGFFTLKSSDLAVVGPLKQIHPCMCIVCVHV